MTNKELVILDTDIGSDVDDALALVFCLRNQKIRLLGVTTVYGPVVCRSMKALTLMEALSINNVPVISGYSRPLSRKHIWVTGYECLGLKNSLRLRIKNLSVVAFMRSKIMANPNKVTIISIAPLTNIAKLFIKYPEVIRKINKLVIMGGELNNDDISQTREHNFSSDIEAAKIVINSGVRIVQVPCEVTRQTAMTHDDMLLLNNNNSSLGKLLNKWTNQWLTFTKTFPKDSIYRNKVYLHDPLTVHFALRNTFNFIQKKNIRMCVSVNVNKFKKEFFQCLLIKI